MTCAACGFSDSPPTPVMVFGQVLSVAGPTGAGQNPVSGTVSVFDKHGQLVGSSTLDGLGSYELDLPPGEFSLVPTNIDVPCPSTPFHVTKDTDQAVNVTCPRK